MIKWILIVFTMSFLADGDLLTKDYLDSGHTNIKSKNGATKGWLNPNVVKTLF